MLIDSHCHLGFDALSGDLDGVIERAHGVGVEKIVTIATCHAELSKTIAIAEKYDNVFFAFGIHPHEAEKDEISLAQFVELAKHPKMIGVGEAGLDYFYDHAPREAQERVFRTHIRAAIETGLPLIIHTRDAEDDTIRILSEEQTDQLRGVFHCYSSNEKLAAYGREIDFTFSFSGMITFKKSENVRKIAEITPLDRMLVETDAPYLAPEPFRGQSCEPAHVYHTAKYLAALKNVDMKTIETATTENFFRLFTKANAS